MRRIRRRRKAGPIMKAAELAIAVPQVVASRTARVLAAGTRPDVAHRAELARMGTEKVEAAYESLFAMGAQVLRSNQEYAARAALQWWRLWTTPWWLAAMRPGFHATATLPRLPAIGLPSAKQRKRAASKLVEAGLTPIHKRATANARRLARKGRR